MEVLAVIEAPLRKSAPDDDSDMNRFFYLSCETGVFRAVKLASLQSWPTIVVRWPTWAIESALINIWFLYRRFVSLKWILSSDSLVANGELKRSELFWSAEEYFNDIWRSIWWSSDETLNLWMIGIHSPLNLMSQQQSESRSARYFVPITWLLL